MSDATQWGAVSVWHHRLLGALWALCGCGAIGYMVTGGRWADYQFWVTSAVAFMYVIFGIGFYFGRSWSRKAMAALMAIAALVFFDMLLMFAVHSNPAAMGTMLAGLGFVAYTAAFLLVSSAWREGSV